MAGAMTDTRSSSEHLPLLQSTIPDSTGHTLPPEVKLNGDALIEVDSTNNTRSATPAYHTGIQNSSKVIPIVPESLNTEMLFRWRKASGTLTIPDADVGKSSRTNGGARSSLPSISHESTALEGAHTAKEAHIAEVPDTTLLQTKKLLAQGLLDIALLTANASQLKNLMETENHPHFQLCFILLITSIILQLIVGILLLVVARINNEPYEPTDPHLRKRHNALIIALNDISTVGIFLITAANIFIATFISHGKAYIPVASAESAYREHPAGRNHS